MTTRHVQARLRGLIPTAASVRWRGSSRDRDVVLTFDDGPDPAGTTAVLKALAGAGATATFFLLGTGVAAWPGLAAQIVSAGHEVGVHADEHRRLDRLPAAAVASALRDTRARIEDAVQQSVTLHRPPYGRVSLAGLRGAARAGLRVLLWSEDPQDFREGPHDDLVARIEAALRPGAVVLLHDGAATFPGQGRNTASALAAALDRARDRELRWRTGSTLW